MIRILVADDHLMFREGLHHLLGREGRMQIVAEASSSVEALAKAREVNPHVILLDIGMPGRGGPEAVGDIKAWNPYVHILMLTSHPEDHYAIRCLKAGADGYVTKDAASDELIAAILKVYSGGKYISPTLAEMLAVGLTPGLDRPIHERLSDRELQVFTMLASGKAVSEIGLELHLSVKTVSTYRARILEKMNFRNNAEIVRYALQEGLVD